MSRTIVVADVGGTHARFALAEIGGSPVIRLDEPVTLKTAEHASFQTAWEEFVVQEPPCTVVAIPYARAVPRAAKGSDAAFPRISLRSTGGRQRRTLPIAGNSIGNCCRSRPRPRRKKGPTGPVTSATRDHMARDAAINGAAP